MWVLTFAMAFWMQQPSPSIEEAIRLYLSPAEIQLPPTATSLEVTVG